MAEFESIEEFVAGHALGEELGCESFMDTMLVGIVRELNDDDQGQMPFERFLKLFMRAFPAESGGRRLAIDYMVYWQPCNDNKDVEVQDQKYFNDMLDSLNEPSFVVALAKEYHKRYDLKFSPVVDVTFDLEFSLTVVSTYMERKNRSKGKHRQSPWAEDEECKYHHHTALGDDICDTGTPNQIYYPTRDWVERVH